ncbi:nitrate reductase [Achromobacter spanius]|uniref:nitrate reductase n=1 Tax=Achromobacter spanius TaxID=217203 RepID=UPI001F0C5E7A|nr:nitrate reductase [Achromobacter spanius]
MDMPLRRIAPLSNGDGAKEGHAHEGERELRSVCCYCGTGCGVRVQVRDGAVLRVRGDEDHPANHGKLCSKGLALADTVRRDGARVLSAQWRESRGAAHQNIALDQALDIAAQKLADTILAHGPDAVGFYLSGQLLTEDYAVFNKLARALAGTNNIDTNSRLCMSSAVSGYKRTLGADAPPACYDDLDLADTVLIAGSNMAYAHPVLFRRLEAARARRPGMKVIVVDPRRTDTAAFADLHLPIAPGTDVALFHAMLHVMAREGRIDQAYIERHTDGFDALMNTVEAYPPAVAQEICGVPAADIIQAARWFGSGGAALSLYTMGLNQSTQGTDKNAALIHLHLATGQIGKPGAGPFSLTGQPNAMGGREAGGMATLLPGHRDPAVAQDRAEVAALWGVDRLPDTPGATALELFDAVLDGRVKVLWIAATNPAQSLPDQARVRAALEQAEFVIVQEAFTGTETLAYADLVLPAATWPEKSGTVTNSERRVSRVHAAVAPPGDAQPDWRLAQAVAQRLAARIAPEKAAGFAYRDEAEVFAEHVRMTAGRDLDYSALDYGILDRDGPQQWPYRAGQGTTRLYADGAFPTPNGRARFCDVRYLPPADALTPDFPMPLTTGRLRDHWHTMARTSLARVLTQHVEEPWLSLHPETLQRLGLAPGTLARLRSRRGSVVLPVQADEGLQRGHAFLPMHWGSAYMSGLGVNALASPATDPFSRQPELKFSAVAVEPAALPWQAAGWLQGDSVALRARLAPWLRRFDYAVVLPSSAGGVRIRVAAAQAPDVDVINQLAQSLDLGQADVVFDDLVQGKLRRVAVAQDGVRAFLLTGDMRAQDALLSWAAGGQAPASVSALLAGRISGPARSRTVCACVGVSEAAILAGIARGCDLDGLKSTLGCGTGCGSCVPEVRALIARAPTRVDICQARQPV